MRRPYEPGFRIGVLDGLRFFAPLFVAFSHCGSFQWRTGQWNYSIYLIHMIANAGGGRVLGSAR